MPVIKPWIRDNGTISEEEVTALLRSKAFLPSKGYLAAAYYTDAFAAAAADRLLNELQERADTLLELRVFNESREIWLHRSRIGAPFFWRIASEEGLERGYCFETRQLLNLDGNPDPGASDEQGTRLLRTFNGHAYSLPVSDKDCYVRLMNYVSYEESGVANAADYRLLGFSETGLAAKRREVGQE